MHARRHAITVQAAFILAAKLRRAGVFTSGREVLNWPRFTIGAARLWLETVEPRGPSWVEFMGADLPRPSPRPWPQYSARGRGVDGAGL